MKNHTTHLFIAVFLISFNSFSQKSEKLKRWEYPKHQHGLAFEMGLYSPNYYNSNSEPTNETGFNSSYFIFQHDKGLNSTLSYNYQWNFWARMHVITGLKLGVSSGNNLTYNFDGRYIDSIPYTENTSDEFSQFRGIAPFGAPRKHHNSSPSASLSIPLALGYNWEFRNGFSFKVNAGISASYVFNNNLDTTYIQDYIDDIYQNVMYYEESSNPNHRVQINLDLGIGLGFITKKGFPIYLKANLATTIHNQNNFNQRLTVLPNQNDKTIVREYGSNPVSGLTVGLEIGLIKLKKKV